MSAVLTENITRVVQRIAQEFKTVKAATPVIDYTPTDPGVDSPLEEGHIVLVYGSGSGSGSVGRFGADYDIWVGVVDANGKLYSPPSDVKVDLVFTGVKDLGNRILAHRFYLKFQKNINSISFPDLEQITGTYALEYFCSWNSEIKNLSFPKLKHISGSYAFSHAFYLSGGLTDVSFPSLLTVTGDFAFANAFENISSLTALHFPVLKQIGSDTHTSYTGNGGHFNHIVSSNNNCRTLSFPELTAIYCTGGSGGYNGTFAGNDKLQRIDFPKLTVIDKSPAYAGSTNVTSHQQIFYQCPALTEIHFGAANQAAIEATEGYPTLWGRGAGNATVYFDL